MSVAAVSGPPRDRRSGASVETEDRAVVQQGEELFAVVRPDDGIVPKRAHLDGDVEEAVAMFVGLCVNEST